MPLNPWVTLILCYKRSVSFFDNVILDLILFVILQWLLIICCNWSWLLLSFAYNTKFFKQIRLIMCLVTHLIHLSNTLSYSNHVQITYRSYTNYIQITYNHIVLTNRIQITYKSHTNQILSNGKSPLNKNLIYTIFWE